MSAAVREIYASANGDRWLLVRDTDSGNVAVRHLPAGASGGNSTLIELGNFLSRDRGSPQHQELVRIIGSLVADDS